MKIENHYINTAQQILSPNCDERPDSDDISLLVIHCISLPPQQFGGQYIEQLFCNQLNPDEHPYFKEIWQCRVSSHLLIRRDGQLVQFVPFQKRAWHAGPSSFQGRERCNDFSIGIELEGTDTEPYTEQQYQQLSQVIVLLLKSYPSLSQQRITGHCNIAPDRKTDPGPSFDWLRLNRLLGNKIGSLN